MPKTRTITLEFPRAGVVRSHAVQKPPVYSTIRAVNVWDSTWPSGRQRGGTRPGLTSVGSIGAPYSWIEANWLASGVLRRGVAVTNSGGTSVSTDGSSWNASAGITTAPGSDFSSAAIYMGQLIQSSIGTQYARFNTMGSGAGAGSSLTHGPTYCGIVVAHGDRLFFMGDKNNAQIVYAMRIGGDSVTPGTLNTADAFDYSVPTTDAGGAWANAGAEGGKLGEAITCGISHSSQCLLIGCLDSIYVIYGNPKSTGELKTLSPGVGPLMQAACAHDAQGNLWFMARDGLYIVPSGCGAPPQSMSKGKLPAELRNCDPGAGDWCAVGYDIRFGGIHIFVDKASGGDSHWFYSMASEDFSLRGFYENTFSNGPMRLAPDFKSVRDATKSAMMPISSGGSVYQFDSSSTSESFAAELWYGPLALGGSGAEGILHKLMTTLAENSGHLSWEIYVGGSAQEAFNSTAAYSSTTPWTRAGLNYANDCRMRGAFAYLRVFSTGSTRWAMENVDAWIEPCGLRRIH